VQHTHPLAARGNAAAISSNQRCHLALLHLPESGRAASALCSDLLPLRSDVATGNRSDRCREPRRLRRLVGGETRESRPPQAVASPFWWSSPRQPRPSPFTSGGLLSWYDFSKLDLLFQHCVSVGSDWAIPSELQIQ